MASASSMLGPDWFSQNQIDAFLAHGKTGKDVADECVALNEINQKYSVSFQGPNGRMVSFNPRLHRYVNILPYIKNNFHQIGSKLENQMIALSSPMDGKIRSFLKKLALGEVKLIVNLVGYDPVRAPQYTPTLSNPAPLDFFGGRAICTGQSEEAAASWKVVQREIQVELYQKKPREGSLSLNDSDDLISEMKSYLNGEVQRTYSFTQLHVSDWQDKTPGPDSEMFALVERVDTLIESLGLKDSEVAIHCSAGVGRTGQFYYTLEIYRALKADPNAMINPFEIAQRGLEHRAHFGLHDKHQYFNLYTFTEFARAQLKRV